MALKYRNFIVNLSLVTAVFICLFFNFISCDKFSVAMDDDTYYIRSGIDLVSGKYVEARMPPFYPLLIGLLTLITKDGFLSAKIISLIAGCFLIVPLYFLSKEIYSRKAALLSVFLASIFPYRIILSNTAKTESLYTFLTLAASCVFLRSLYRRKINGWITLVLGVLFSALYLTRPEGLLYLPIFFSYAFFLHRKIFDKKMIARLLIILMVFMSFALPYVLFLHKQTGRWTLTGKDDNFLFSDWVSKGGEWHHLNKLNAQASGIALDKPEINFTEAAINGLVRYADNSYAALGIIGKIFSPVLLIFLGIGLLEMAQGIARDKKLFLVFLMMPMLVYPFFHVKGDYLYPAFLPFLIIIAQGIVYAGQYFKAKKTYFIIIILVISFVFLRDFKLSGNKLKADSPSEKKEIGLWMKDNLPQGGVLDLEPISSFYAQMPYVMLPYADLERTLKYAESKKAAYLILTRRDKIKYNSEISRLFDSPNICLNLELIKKISNKDNFDVFLFRIKR